MSATALEQGRDEEEEGEEEEREEEEKEEADPAYLLTQACGSQNCPGLAQGNVKSLLLLAAEQMSW